MEIAGQLQFHYPGPGEEEEGEEEEWPWTVLNHIPRIANEYPLLYDERVYLFQGHPNMDPKLLRLFADGGFVVQHKVRPSNTDLLEVIDHSRGQICFRNASRRQIWVWNLQAQSVRAVLEDVDELGLSSYGFGHSNGLFMVVRLGRPALFSNGVDYGYHIHTVVEGQQQPWARAEFRLNARFNFINGGNAILVSQYGMLYWKAELDGGAYLITYNLETRQLAGLLAPREDGVNNAGMVLGHGFNGQLAAAVFVPPAVNDDYSMLHIWLLQREGPSFYWHKLVAFRSTVFDAADVLFIPLVIYYGVGDDGAIHILLHRNREEIVCVVPAIKQVLPVENAGFQPAPILAIPGGIPMEVGDARRFKAVRTSGF